MGVNAGECGERYGQGPLVFTPVPATAATQALSYVLPSHPQTGAYSLEHAGGRAMHVAEASVAPQFCPTWYAQYSVAAHEEGANPPHGVGGGQARCVQVQPPPLHVHVLQRSVIVSPSTHVMGHGPLHDAAQGPIA